MIRTLTIIVLASVFFVRVGFAANSDKLNVLFIVSDDLSARLGCYGDPYAKTPHLDRLAQRGVLFERAYCQNPLCNPSRASFLTGLRPDTLQVYDLDTHFRSVRPDVVTLPQTFQRHGYTTARVGKLFHYNVPASIGTDGFDDPASWDRVVNPRGRDVIEEDKIFTLTPEKDGPQRVSGTLSWLAADGTDSEQTDGMIADSAVEMLEELRSKPFFLGVGFFRPHTPFVAPRPWFEMYPLTDIQLPAVPDGWLKTIPAAAREHRKPYEDHLSSEHGRLAMRAYYATISFVDGQVGKLLDALDRLELTSKTIVVFTSDHGYHLGDHELWQKRSLYDWSARVPLIVSVPGNALNGQVSDRPVELVSLHATLADLCGLKAPQTEGLSFRSLIEDPSAAWTHPAYTQVARLDGAAPAWKKGSRVTYHGHTLRTEEWRYVEWDGGARGTELYDVVADPEELVNLADDPRHTTKVATLRKQLDQQFPERRRKLPDDPRGMRPLFDGVSIDGWIQYGGTARYRVEDGCIVGTTTDSRKNSFLAPPRDYGDFELEFEVQCDPRLNSGVQIRSRVYEQDTPQASQPTRIRETGETYGYQCEIADRTRGTAANFWDEGRWTKWWSELSPKAQDAFRDHEWNRYRIVAQGDHIRSWINGVPAADFHDDTDASGFIGFQVHAVKAGEGPYEVRWRDVRIRELSRAE